MVLTEFSQLDEEDYRSDECDEQIAHDLYTSAFFNKFNANADGSTSDYTVHTKSNYSVPGEAEVPNCNRSSICTTVTVSTTSTSTTTFTPLTVIKVLKKSNSNWNKRETAENVDSIKPVGSELSNAVSATTPQQLSRKPVTKRAVSGGDTADNDDNHAAIGSDDEHEEGISAKYAKQRPKKEAHSSNESGTGCLLKPNHKGQKGQPLLDLLLGRPTVCINPQVGRRDAKRQATETVSQPSTNTPSKVRRRSEPGGHMLSDNGIRRAAARRNTESLTPVPTARGRLACVNSSDEDEAIFWSSDGDDLALNIGKPPPITPKKRRLTVPLTKEEHGRLWYISDEDRLPRKRARSQWDVECANCRKMGHLKEYCRMPRRDLCFCCGGEHHVKRCKQRFCSMCKRPGHLSDQCRMIEEVLSKRCKECTQIGHEVARGLGQTCPDLWRRYHCTTKPGPPLPAVEVETLPRERTFCTYCAGRGHTASACRRALNDFVFASSLEVFSYRQPQEGVDGWRVSKLSQHSRQPQSHQHAYHKQQEQRQARYNDFAEDDDDGLQQFRDDHHRNDRHDRHSPHQPIAQWANPGSLVAQTTHRRQSANPGVWLRQEKQQGKSRYHEERRASSSARATLPTTELLKKSKKQIYHQAPSPLDIETTTNRTRDHHHNRAGQYNKKQNRKNAAKGSNPKFSKGTTGADRGAYYY